MRKRVAPFLKKEPKIHKTAYALPGTCLTGDVRLEAHANIWYGCVLRGDLNYVKVGRYSNVQDNSVLHVEDDTPCVIGNYVTVGHAAIIHACYVGDGSLIGMGALLLNRCHIGKESQIAAGAVVKEGMKVPPRSLVVGVPGRIIRKLTSAEVKKNRKSAYKYVKLAQEHRDYLMGG